MAINMHTVMCWHGTFQGLVTQVPAAALVEPGDLSFPLPTILVTQTPEAALVEPGDLLNPLIKTFSFQEPLPPFFGYPFHVLLLLSWLHKHLMQVCLSPEAFYFSN